MNQENIEEILKRIGRQDVPADVQAMAEETAENFSETLMPPRQHILWRTIMKSRITKLAAAAVIILAVALGTYIFVGDGAAVALADVIENMKEMPWMHMVSKGFERGVKGTGEQWISFQSKVWIGKEADGTIVYFDYGKHENYTYDPSSQTITISYLHEDGPSVQIASPWSALEGLVEVFTEQGAEIVQAAGQHKGKPVEIHRISLMQNGVNSELQLFTDPQSRLLLAGLVKATDANANLVMDGEIEFDYPQNGPTSIYDLGLPASVKVVNHLPSRKVLEILEHYQHYREEGPKEYIAIVANENKSERVIYRNGDLMRTDYRYVKDRQGWARYAKQMPGSFDSALRWWSNDSNGELTQVYLYDGKYDHYVYGLRGNPKTDRTHGRNPNHKGLAEIGWPNISIWFAPGRQVKTIETEYSTTNDLMCIELLLEGGVNPHNNAVSLPGRQLYYLDPSRDYICVRTESHAKRDAPWQKDDSWLESVASAEIPPDSYAITEMTEFAQTDAGQWYPKKIQSTWPNDTSEAKQRESFRTIYLKTNPDFPEGIFDPRNLPNARE